MQADWVDRLFRVKRHELAKVSLFTLMAALLQAGIAIGISVSDSIFLARLGADKLPWVFILLPFVMVLLIPLFNAWISRFGITRVFGLSMLVIAVAGVVLFSLFTFIYDSLPEELALVILFVVKIWPFALMLALNSLFWVMVSGYFDIFDAKRLFAFFNGGLALGAMLGGALVSSLSSALGVGPLFLLWSVLGLACLPLARMIKTRYRRLEEVDEAESGGGFFSQVGLVSRAMRSSRYILLVNLSILLLFFLTTLAEFQYMEIFSGTRSEQDLVSLFGLLFTLANLFNLVVNFFLFNRMVGFLGVRNIVLLQPLIYLGCFVWLAVERSQDAAILAFFAYQGLMTAVELNNLNFIFNAVPSSVRRQVRSFAEGIGDPLATGLAGVLLLVIINHQAGELIPRLGLGVSILYLLISFFTRARYRQSLLESLRRDWLDFSQGSGQKLQLLSAEELIQGIDESRQPSRLLLLGALVEKAPLIATRKILTLIDARPEVSRALAELLKKLIDLGESEVLREITLWSFHHEEELDSSIQEILASGGLLIPGDCAWGEIPWLIAGLVSKYPEENLEALKLISAYSKTQEDRLETALRALGLAGNPAHAWWVAEFCAHPRQGVRVRAAEAVACLVTPNEDGLVPKLLPLLRRGEDEREQALKALAKIGDVGMVNDLLLASDFLSPRERRQVLAIIASIGIKAVPALVGFLLNHLSPAPLRWIAAQALARTSWAQFEQLLPSLVNSELEAAYRAVALRLAFLESARSNPARRVLARCRKSETEQRVLFILELMALGGRVGDVDLLAASLRSNNLRQWANAIESLEQDIPGPVFRKLLPLIDNRSEHDCLKAGKKFFNLEAASESEAVESALASRERLSQAAALQLLAERDPGRLTEVGAGLLRDESDSLVSQTLRALLTREFEGLTPVEEIDLLARSDVFGELGIDDLLAVRAALIQEPASATIKSLCLIRDREQPLVLNRELLWGEDKPLAFNQGPALLYLDPSLVRQLAQTRPRIASRLLRLVGGQA